MKIAYFAEIFPSVSETWVHHEIRQLREMGCDVRVFATHARPTTIAPELREFVDITTYLPEVKKSLIDLVRVFFSPAVFSNVLIGIITDCPWNRQKLQVLRDIAIAGLFSKRLAAYRPQFILAHFGGTRANLALISSLVTDIRFGIKFHARDVFTRTGLLRLKAKRAAMLMTISKFNHGFMCEHYPDIDFSSCRVHKCGIPLEEYQFQPKSTLSDVFVIMSAGRLVPKKGFHVLLGASKRLIERGFSHKVKIYGDGPARKQLEQLIGSMSLEGTVELMGYASPVNVREALLDSDLFVLPAVFDPIEKMDGIPVALMEAMAIGVPVISTKISGIPELIEDRVNGFLAVSGDPESLAEAILRLYRLSEDERRKMLLAARMKIESDHDVHKLSRVLKQDLLDCLRIGAGEKGFAAYDARPTSR